MPASHHMIQGLKLHMLTFRPLRLLLQSMQQNEKQQQQTLSLQHEPFKTILKKIIENKAFEMYVFGFALILFHFLGYLFLATIRLSFSQAAKLSLPHSLALNKL